MSQIAITTSQNVHINFTLASVGERMAAFFLDILFMAAYVIVLTTVLSGILDVDSFFNRMDNWSARATMILIFLPITFYALLTESIFEGQTFGKKLLKIKVVKIDGYQASFSDYLIRWLFRSVEIYLLMSVPALLSMIISKNNQRLGGIASGTAVISLRNNVDISHTILENLAADYVPQFPQVIALSDNDMRIIKDNYQKALKTDDTEVITKLSAKIKEILKLDFDDREMTNRKFVNIIIKDYNYFTGKDQ